MAELATATKLSRVFPSAHSLVRPGLVVQAEPALGIGKIQVLGNDPESVLLRVTGVAAPPACAQTDHQGFQFAWLSPSEWLLTGPEDRVAAMLALTDDRGGDQVLAVDLTHARVSLLISGEDTRDVLASLCPLDLWSENFPVHAVARSLLGDVGIFLARLRDLNDLPRFRIVVDHTMSAYAVRMLAGPPSR